MQKKLLAATKHLPKRTPSFQMVIDNLSARLGCSQLYAELMIKIFIDETKKVSKSEKRVIIPQFIEIEICAKAAKVNNIAVKKGMSNEDKLNIPIVPSHSVAKIKPHIVFKEFLKKKKEI